MVKDHSDNEKGNPLLPHRLLLSINSKGSFICTIPPVMEHWLEQEIDIHTEIHTCMHLSIQTNRQTVRYKDTQTYNQTIHLRLYGVRHMVKDHSDSEKGNPLPPHRLLLSIRGFFYMHHPTDRIKHTTAFVTPVVEHWLEREIAQWVHPMKDRSDDPSHHERTLYL